MAKTVPICQRRCRHGSLSRGATEKLQYRSRSRGNCFILDYAKCKKIQKISFALSGRFCTPNFKHIFAPPAKIFVISESSRYFSELEYSQVQAAHPFFPEFFCTRKLPQGRKLFFFQVKYIFSAALYFAAKLPVSRRHSGKKSLVSRRS